MNATERIMVLAHAYADAKLIRYGLPASPDASRHDPDARASDLRARVAELDAKNAELANVYALAKTERDEARANLAKLEARGHELIDQRDQADNQNDLLLEELRQSNAIRSALHTKLAWLEAMMAAPRGTDAQILKERELTCSAVSGAMAYGYQGGEAPPDDTAWLRPFYEAGQRAAELEAERDALRARLAERDGQKPAAFVPIHPRNGPLWANCTDNPDPERLPSYPLQPLYLRPATRAEAERTPPPQADADCGHYRCYGACRHQRTAPDAAR